jgi:hypothetical protein
MRTIVLELDEDDWNTIQDELARAQAYRDKDGAILPEGESNLPGAIIGEAIRDLEEYRALWRAENPQ